MDIEQQNYPYYLVSEIEITGYTETKIKYRVTICSKLDPKCNLPLSDTRTIEISKILEYYRDNLIQKILE